MGFRTDLAMEDIFCGEHTDRITQIPGVRAENDCIQGVARTRVEILNDAGERALGKPKGNYVTLELPKDHSHDAGQFAQTVQILAEELQSLMQLQPQKSVMVVGLGNRLMTPDAVGPRVLDKTIITRHLPEMGLRMVSGLIPGVQGSTGIESAELTNCAAKHIRPDCILVIDALAAREPSRLCTTIQITDTGIIPGSGISGGRAAFNAVTLGVPVFALGVPTVITAACLCGCPEVSGDLLVTLSDIDVEVGRISRLLAYGINQVLFPDLRLEDIAGFVE